MGSLTDLACTYRAGQLVVHYLHNCVKGPTFFEDHEFLGELYGKYEEAYDGLVERMLGLGEDVDIAGITKKAGVDAGGAIAKCGDVGGWPKIVLGLESLILDECKRAFKGASVGTQNFVGQLADDSEQRVYKVSRRAMK